jgi:hypothetical protein
MIWLLPRLWRLIKHIFRRIGSWLGLCEPPEPIDSQTKSLASGTTPASSD